MQWGKYSFFEIPFVQYGNSYSNRPSDFSSYLKNENNYNDSRLNNCNFSRTCAAIISRNIFFDDEKEKIVENEIKELEQKLMESSISDKKFDSYFIQKNENIKMWNIFYNCGVEREGHPLQNWNGIIEDVRDAAFALYKKELRMDISPLDSSLWDE